MQFTSIAVPLVALIASVQAATSGPSVTVYADSACTKAIQTIQMSQADYYQCYEFMSTTAKAVILSKTGFGMRGFNVWDSQYCAGDQGGSPSVLGQCLSASSYGLTAWKSAHISPRNITGQI